MLAGCLDLGDTTKNDVSPEEVDPPVIDSTPVVAIPTDVDWELIATLQRDPLSPGEFYIFPEQNEAISKAYEGGEIGGEFNEGWGKIIRHYIIHPEILSRSA